MSAVDDFVATHRLDPRVAAKLAQFATLFLKWNQSINLSAARTDRDLQPHILDSLHIVPHLSSLVGQPSLRVLDVGAGGGLPAVVAAIALPNVHVTALEPVHKKHAFLRTCARELSLANLSPLAERIDAHAHLDYDAAMSRATFDLREWIELALRYVRPGGTAFGFEAVPRTDLPPETKRSNYSIDGKPRSIVSVVRD